MTPTAKQTVDSNCAMQEHRGKAMQPPWKPSFATALGAILLSACSDSGHGGSEPMPQEPLELSRVMGGQLADLVVSGQLAYVATGRVVATWDFRDPSAP